MKILKERLPKILTKKILTIKKSLLKNKIMKPEKSSMKLLKG
jgi:hypothetical protein